MNAVYNLISVNIGGKEMFNERFGKFRTPATRVIYIHLFMLSVLISSLSDMQHHLRQVILQWRKLQTNWQVLWPRMEGSLSILHAKRILETLPLSMPLQLFWMVICLLFWLHDPILVIFASLSVLCYYGNSWFSKNPLPDILVGCKCLVFVFWKSTDCCGIMALILIFQYLFLHVYLHMQFVHYLG